MGAPHVVPWKTYLAVFVALCALTVITVEAAGHDFGLMNTAIALVIAVTKATLVILFFMHVKYSSRLTSLMLAAGLVWLAILMAFTLSDYISRPWPIVTGS